MRPRGAVLAAATVALFAAAPAQAARPTSPLVLSRSEAPGLKLAGRSGAMGRAALAAALKPAKLPRLRAAGAAHYARRRADLWSVAFVLGKPAAADKALRATLRAAKRAHLVRVPVPVGDRGWLVRRRDGPVVVVWRSDRGLGAIVLRVPRRSREIALAYARVANVHLTRELTETAWQRTVDRVRPDGTVPRKVVFDLFALAYRPLPGHRRPPGPPGAPEGTTAGNHILKLWRTLTPAQRAVVEAELGITGVDLGKRARHVARQSRAATYGDPKFVQVAQYETWAKGFVETYANGAHLNEPLALKVVAGTSSAAQDDDTYRITEDGLESAAGKLCRTRISPKSVGRGTGFVRFVLAHEMFHCFQFQIDSPFEGNDWVFEGTAEWAALSITQAPWKPEGGWFEEYISGCSDKTIFQRGYDGLGFFGRAEETTGVLWPRLAAILKAHTDEGSYNAAGGDQDALLDAWGSSVNNKSWGLPWTTADPIPVPASAHCESITPVSEGPVEVAPYALMQYKFTGGGDSERPLLNVKIEGHARIGDGKLDMASLADAWFCVSGECKCPEGQEGTPPPAPPLGGDAHLALTGGPKGAKGKLELHSLKEYCKKKQDPPPQPGGGGPIGGGGPGGGGGGSGCSTGCGSSNGDPHLTTLDGLFYDFQGAGEYTLVRSTKDSLQIQAREEPYPGSTTLAINTAIAMGVAGDRVAVYRGDPPLVRVNRAGFTPRRRSQKLPHGGRIRSVAGQIEVAWPDGSLARVWSVGPWGVAVLFKPVLARRGTLVGLLGNFDGDRANDFATRRGRRLPEARVLASRRVLYRVYGDSWRIRQGSSLFDYARGHSTGTFTKRSFPHALATPKMLAPRARRAAERYCRRLHITNPRIFAACVLDVAGTGDARFATAGARLQRTGVKFGKPPKGRGVLPGVVDKRWTAISTAGKSNTVVPSIALDGGKVVVAYRIDGKSAEAVTFTPSPAADVVGARRDQITSSWSNLDDPVLLPRPGGGLQVLFSGLHSTTTTLNGTLLQTRSPDGSFGPPALVTDRSAAEVGGAAVLAPDGQPLWASFYTGALSVWHGATNPASADLSQLVNGTDYVPSVGRDSAGRYWLAWYVIGSKLTSGLWVVQLDPSSLQPIGPAQRAPDSGSIDNDSLRLAFPCARQCRLVYHQGNLASEPLVSWAPGERKATVVAGAAPRDPWIAAVYTTGGRMWVVWFNGATRRYEAKLGDAAGRGGTVAGIGQPSSNGDGFAVSVAATSAGLVVVLNWVHPNNVFSRYVNVVRPR